MSRLVRLLRVLLFQPFTGPAAIRGGSGKWVDKNPNETFGSDGEPD